MSTHKSPSPPPELSTANGGPASGSHDAAQPSSPKDHATLPEHASTESAQDQQSLGPSTNNGVLDPKSDDATRTSSPEGHATLPEDGNTEPAPDQQSSGSSKPGSQDFMTFEFRRLWKSELRDALEGILKNDPNSYQPPLLDCGWNNGGPRQYFVQVKIKEPLNRETQEKINNKISEIMGNCGCEPFMWYTMG